MTKYDAKAILNECVIACSQVDASIPIVSLYIYINFFLFPTTKNTYKCSHD